MESVSVKPYLIVSFLLVSLICHSQSVVIGKWECTFNYYEGVITFYKTGNAYSARYDYNNIKKKPLIETLRKENNKYFIVGSDANEYYIINDVGNLESWDRVGLLTTSRNIMLGGKPLPPKAKYNIKTVQGRNVFDVQTTYSKSSPETLEGTNNNYWIIYLKDINSTFKVDKSTDKILKAEVGRVPKLN
jgi:hypothetical protein